MPDRPYVLGSAALERLDGKPVTFPGADESLVHAWDALIQASAPLAAHFGYLATWYRGGSGQMGGPGGEDLLATMLTWGRFLEPEAAWSPGDLVCLGGESRPARGSWVTVVLPRSPGAALVLGVDEPAAKHDLVELEAATPAYVWRPSPLPVVDPQSPPGRFWGPGLGRYRELLTLSARSGTVASKTVSEALEIAFRFSAVPTASVAEAVAGLDPPARTGVDPSRLPACALVFDPGRELMGVIGPGGIAMVATQSAEWRTGPAAKCRLPLGWVAGGG